MDGERSGEKEGTTTSGWIPSSDCRSLGAGGVGSLLGRPRASVNDPRSRNT